MRTYIPFGPMLRDGSDYDSPALDEARNVLPVHGVYRPIRRLRTVSQVESDAGLTPWLEFAGVDATSKVDFTINPLKLPIPIPGGDHATIGIRFRTGAEDHHGLICGAGLDGIVGFPEGFGWAVGTEQTPGFVRFSLGPGSVSDPDETVWSRVQIPGGYNDGEWHVLRADLSAFGPLGEPPVMHVEIHADGVSGGVALTNDIPNGPNWTALDMRWGYGEQDLQRFEGDVERVLFWDRSPSNIEFDEAMNAAPGSISPGGWSEATGAYPILANTGVTVVNYGTVGSAGDGTMDAGVDWGGPAFNLSGVSGITGGIAHFYTDARDNRSRAPGTDITKGEFLTFGMTHGGHPDDFFRQLWSKEPDDSRGILYGLMVEPGDTETSGTSSYEGKFFSFADPLVNTGHSVQYRYRFNGTPTQSDFQKLAVYLYQGATEIALLDEHEAGTEAEDGEERNVWHHGSVTLTALQAAAITNYSDLRIRAVVDITGAERQAALPIADLSNPDSWENQDGEKEDLWESIDDPFTPDDETFLQTPGVSPGGSTRAVFALSGVENPRHGNGFNIVVRAQAIDSGMDLVTILREDGVEISRHRFTDIPTEPTNLSFEIPEPAARKVSDFAALELSVVFVAHEDPGDGDDEEGLLPTAFDGPLVNTTGTIEDLLEEDGNTVDTGAGGDGGRFRVHLSDGEDPDTDEDHKIRIVGHRTGGDAQVSVQLYSGGTQVYDSRENGGPIPLSTTPGTEVVWELPTGAVSQITDYKNLRIQVLTHAALGGGTAHYDLLTLLYPGAGAGGRQARVYWSVVGFPSDMWVGLSWARMFVPKPDSSEAGDVTELYAGDYTNIYLVNDSPWSLVSKAGGYATGTVPRSWAFTSFGDNVVATNKVDPVQVKVPDEATYKDLITSTQKPQAACCCVVQRHLILGNIEYTGAGGGDPDGHPDEWWCSGLDAPEDFDIALLTGANRGRTQMTAGEIVGCLGGDFALLFKRGSVLRLDYVGPPGTFKEAVVTSTDGTPFPRSIVQVGRDAYFLDTDGFKVVRQGQYVERVGDGAVNRMVTDSAFESRAVQPVDTDNIPEAESACVGAYDSVTNTIWWAIRTKGILGDDPAPVWRNNVIVMYNPPEDRWSFAEVEGPTLDPGDDPIRITHLYGLPSEKEASDSIARGIGAISLIGTFPTEYALAFQRFLGQSTYSCQFRTKIWSSKLIDKAIQELQINFLRPSYRMAPESTARPNVRLIVESSDDPLMQFGVRTKTVNLADANADLWYPVRESGEYYRFTVAIPPLVNETIRELNGLGIDYQKAGTR